MSEPYTRFLKQQILNIWKIIPIEFFIWVAFAFLISGGFIFDTFFYEIKKVYDSKTDTFIILNPFSEVVKNHYTSLLFSALCLLFPLAYSQIFGKSFLQTLREGSGSFKNKNVVVHGSGNIINFEKEKISESNNLIRVEDNVISLLNKFAKGSENLSNKLYVRSGVYLMFGVLIAFGGILFFSFQSISPTNNADTVQNLIFLAPKFGILFFIEFIAFFFLKQYRAAMDEFRYYDSIKRNRESQLAIFLIATETFKEKKFVTVIDKMNFFKNVDKLSAGETTELLESYKANKNEFEMLKDIVVRDMKPAPRASKATASK